MAFVHYVVAVPYESINPTHTRLALPPPPRASSSSLWIKPRKLSLLPKPFRTFRHQARAKLPDSQAISAADAFTQFKHVLLPITDKNPYLSEGTRQAAATAAGLAKKYEADITVVVIEEDPKESVLEYDKKLSSLRWHLSEGGFQEFRIIERLGEGKKPTAIIGEIADDLNLDLVVISMDAIHSKHVDANLLAEFIPCPVLLLPL